MTDYVSVTDKGAVLETPPCDHADLYLYVIAREFPASTVISASPPFEIELAISTNGRNADGDLNTSSTAYSVNQWGGLSVKVRLE
jgi:hypothetical protein